MIPHSPFLDPHSLVLRTVCLSPWLILFSRMVSESLLTLAFLLIGMVYQVVYPNSWTRFSSKSLSKLTEDFYAPDSRTIQFSSLLEPVSYEMPDHIFARIWGSEGITVPGNIGHPSSCGPTNQVDNTVRCPSVASRGCLLIHRLWSRYPCLFEPHAAHYTAAASITPARQLEAVGTIKARVQIWWLAHTTPDAST